MSDGEHDEDAGATGIVGQPVEEAAAAVAARADTPDDETAIAATLRPVSEDGIVRLDAVDDAIADASMYLSTAEGRVEFAAVTVQEVREAVADVTDVPFVASRLDGFDARVTAIEDEAGALAEALQDCIERKADPERVYETARELARIKNEADQVQARADRLKVDVDEFESMVTDPERGFVELLGDLNALDGLLGDLETTAEELSTVLDGRREAADAYDPARVWFEATVRHRLNGLVFDDVRAELESIRTIAAEHGVEETERDAEVEEQLDEVRARWAAVRDELDAVAPAAWHDTYGDRIDEVEARTAEAEPPIDWDAVEADLGEYLSAE
jgi:chromosome segregation ATPase